LWKIDKKHHQSLQPMSLEKLFWIDQKIVTEKEALISCLDLGLMRGLGVFDFFRTYKKQPFHLKEHLERFFHSAKKTGLSVPYTKEQITAQVHDLISAYKGNEDLGIKMILTGGISDDGMTSSGKPHYWIYALPLNNIPSKNPIKLKTIQGMRELHAIKSLNYLHASIGIRQAKLEGFDDILYVNSHEEISESSTSNIFFVSAGSLYTPSEKILKGITREVILQLSKEHFDMKIGSITMSDIPYMEECFMTSTTKEIIRISHIDDIKFAQNELGSSVLLIEEMFKGYCENDFRFNLEIDF